MYIYKLWVSKKNHSVNCGKNWYNIHNWFMTALHDDRCYECLFRCYEVSELSHLFNVIMLRKCWASNCSSDEFSYKVLHILYVIIHSSVIIQHRNVLQLLLTLIIIIHCIPCQLLHHNCKFIFVIYTTADQSDHCISI